MPTLLFTNGKIKKKGAEFPLSRRMDVSRPSNDMAHWEACLDPTGVYIKPALFASKLKGEQDSSATFLWANYNASGGGGKRST